jgi:FAD/FMN-containing dehydrogenase
MTRFNKVNVDNVANTVAIGAGLIWDDVYAALDGTGLNVCGGRVTGVGVAGFILGGGVYPLLLPFDCIFVDDRVW